MIFCMQKIDFICFYGDIAKICKFILATLGMPGYTHLK